MSIFFRKIIGNAWRDTAIESSVDDIFLVLRKNIPMDDRAIIQYLCLIAASNATAMLSNWTTTDVTSLNDTWSSLDYNVTDTSSSVTINVSYSANDVTIVRTSPLDTNTPEPTKSRPKEPLLPQDVILRELLPFTGAVQAPLTALTVCLVMIIVLLGTLLGLLGYVKYRSWKRHINVAPTGSRLADVQVNAME